MIINKIYKSLIFRREEDICEIHIIESGGHFYSVSNLPPTSLSNQHVREYQKFTSAECADKFLEKLKKRYEKSDGFRTLTRSEVISEAVGPIVILRKKRELLKNGYYCVSRDSDILSYTLLRNRCVLMLWSSVPIKIDRKEFEAQLKTQHQVNEYLDRFNECSTFYKFRLLRVWFAMDNEENILFFIINRPKRNLVQHYSGLSW